MYALLGAACAGCEGEGGRNRSQTRTLVCRGPACPTALTACAWRPAGAGEFGKLGINSSTDSPIPVAVKAPAGVTAWAQVTASYAHSCGVASNGSLWCWGACPAKGCGRRCGASLDLRRGW